MFISCFNNRVCIMADDSLHRFESVLQLGPMTIAIIYLLLGLLWIYFSDDLAIRIAHGNEVQYQIISTFKGFAYILITAILLYITILYFIRKTSEGQAALARSEQQTRILNKKLALMNDITSQDIQNKVTAVRGLIDLSLTAKSDEERILFMNRSAVTLNTIQMLIAKTKDYQKIGVDDMRWIMVEPAIRMQFSFLSIPHTVTLDCDLHNLEIHADPLIDKVFYILSYNAITHGKTVNRITFTSRETPDGLLIVCEDNGRGIPEQQKPHIFDRVVGGDGNFHLFFIREFLSLYNMEIRETGIPANGARFEIRVPKGAYRFTVQLPVS
jgi:signal transduction histidine kinase